MATVLFIYNGAETKIQCNINDKMRVIVDKFIFKIKIEVNKAKFLYGGNQVNFDLTFFEQANQIDKQRKIMNILVYSNDTLKSSINGGIIKSKEVICPQCKENCLIEIKDYKIKLYGCKNGHVLDNILLNEFQNLQNINENEIVCNKCKNIKSEVYNKQFYKCLECNINLCPLCSNQHPKNHELLDYNNIHYYCQSHKDFYVSYCVDCKINLCMKCEIKHNKYHQIVNFQNIFPDEEKIKKKIKAFRKKIDKFKEEITEIINKLSSISKNLERYYKIIYDIFDNYDSRKRNYEILTNVNSIINFIKLKDIDEIVQEKNEFKLDVLFDIYHEMNNKNNKQKYFGDINIIFKCQERYSKIICNKDNLFVEVALKYIQKEIIDQEKFEQHFIFNEKKINLISCKTVSELGIKNNDIIQVLKTKIINNITIIFNYKQIPIIIQVNINEFFYNVASKISNMIGENLSDIRFYYKSMEVVVNDHSTFKDLEIKNFDSFIVVKNQIVGG